MRTQYFKRFQKCANFRFTKKCRRRMNIEYQPTYLKKKLEIRMIFVEAYVNSKTMLSKYLLHTYATDAT